VVISFLHFEIWNRSEAAVWGIRQQSKKQEQIRNISDNMAE